MADIVKLLIEYGPKALMAIGAALLALGFVARIRNERRLKSWSGVGFLVVGFAIFLWQAIDSRNTLVDRTSETRYYRNEIRSSRPVVEDKYLLTAKLRRPTEGK